MSGRKLTGRTEHHKSAVIEALVKSLGVVTTACKMSGVGRTQFYTWLEKDTEFAKAVKDVEDIALDFVESQLYLQIKNGNIAGIIYYLKTKGRKRGYTEREPESGEEDYSLPPVKLVVVK